MRRSIIALSIASVSALASCSSAHHHYAPINLLTSAGIPYTHTPAEGTPLEVVTRSTAVHDPLPVDGTDQSYSDMEGALGFAVASATVPWANAHKQAHPEGWQLFVELTQADAQYDDGRIIVSFGVRATLRTRVGHFYLAQTQAACSQGGVVSVQRGGGVVYACMMRLGRDLADWLGGIEG
jgi:hypothetical protein